MTRRVGKLLIILLCALSLMLHFAAESLGEIHIQVEDGTTAHAFDMHEGDQFVLDESGADPSCQPNSRIPFLSKLVLISRPHTPLLPPPIAS